MISSAAAPALLVADHSVLGVLIAASTTVITTVLVVIAPVWLRQRPLRHLREDLRWCLTQTSSAEEAERLIGALGSAYQAVLNPHAVNHDSVKRRRRPAR